MRAILIDDEQSTLDELGYLFKSYPEFEIDGTFLSPVKAIAHVQALAESGKALPDVVFLDIDMPLCNGLDAAVALRAIHPDIIIIFVTAYSSYALESFRVHPLDYLLKPIKESQFAAATEHIKKQVGLIEANRQNKVGPLRITCFGRFRIDSKEVGREIKWGTRRVRELLLFLIDSRGAPVTHDDLVRVLFDGDDSKKNNNNLYVTMHMLRDLLQSLDPKKESLSLGKDCSLTVAPGVCDYIDFMNFAGRNAIINAENAPQAAAVLNLCKGAYLEDVYSPWVSQTAGAVDAEYERIALSLSAVLARTNPAAAIGVLEQLIARNPLSEEGHTALLDAHLEDGRQEDFQIAYEQYARILKSELGEKPPAKYTLHYMKIRPQ